MGMKFSAGIDETTGKMSLIGCEESALPFNPTFKFPVATFSIKKSKMLPDIQQIAENMAALLNGKRPLHLIALDKADIFYTREGHILSLKTRSSDDPGVSTTAIEITFGDKGHVGILNQEILPLLNANFMKKLCDAVGNEAAMTPQPSGGLHPQF